MADGGVIEGTLNHNSGDYIVHGNTIPETSRFGLNPIWAFNFGDPSVAASATEAGAKDTVLTPVGTLFNLSLALGKPLRRLMN